MCEESQAEEPDVVVIGGSTVDIMGTTIKKNIYGTLNNIEEKYVESIKSYIVDSMEHINKSLIYQVSENSSIFIDLNRYIIIK